MSDKQRVEVSGSTIYVLNARGENLWSAQVQPVKYDDGQRMTNIDVVATAHIIADMLNCEVVIDDQRT